MKTQVLRHFCRWYSRNWL